MVRLRRFVAAPALAVAVVVSLASPALAHDGSRHDHHHGRDHGGGADHVVFVQTDDPNGNTVVAYDRGDDGTLSPAGTFATGGLGGVLAGSVVDHLASQSSLVYDREHALLYAVNAGSNTVSVFAVDGDQLVLREIVPSFGSFPVSIALHDESVYVLNARGGGSVQGYQVTSGVLAPIDGSLRPLGLDPNATPEFTTTPGQVAFTPDGSQLVVTTKGNGSAILVFRVRHHGTLEDTPTVNSEPGTVPFAVTFDERGRLVVSEAGTNSVATYDLEGNGTLNLRDREATNQTATCWIAGIGSNFYVSNAGSGSVTQVNEGHHGSLTFVGNTATDAGTVDASATPTGDFLYVQAGKAGVVDGFRVNGDGSLTAIGSVTVPNAAGGEGIVAL
jgi:6-phosphogluconolactonase (cycloisomerase 2 family)